MPCFCTVPADVARMRFSMPIGLALPPLPLQMKLMAALPALDPMERADIQMAMHFDNLVLPKIDMGGGPLASLALTLNMVMGTFKIDDLPMLEMQMEQAAQSFERNIWPRLSFLSTFKIQPLLDMAICARLVLDLTDMGLDPFNISPSDVPMNSSAQHNFRFGMTPPKLKMMKLMLGLPPLFKVAEALNVPPLGEPESAQLWNNRVMGLAKLSPPTLQIPFPLILKLAMVLESLAKIHEAFGPDALHPSYRSQILAMFKLFMKLNIPIPMPALALKPKIDLLPAMEEIKLAERYASKPLDLRSNFKAPRLSIGPFLNVMLALHMALNVALDMETWDQCATCNS
ncbi:MAG: hypothetical protein AAF317_15430 [Pseudomonadota bacterium]